MFYLSIDTAKLSLKKCLFQLFTVILHYHFFVSLNRIFFIIRIICFRVLMITPRNIIMAYHGGVAVGNERGTCNVDNARRLKDNRILWLSRPSRPTDVIGDRTAKRRPMWGPPLSGDEELWK